jgi:hypothetical protein
MSNENALVVSEKAELRALSKELALSQLLPQALRQKPADVLAIVLTGKELGLEPMQAIRGIHIISGKAALSADLMGALVKRSSQCEYLTLVLSSDTIATYKTKRRGEPGETEMSFTIEQAAAAGLSKGDNWRKYPGAMLRARALAQICRAVYPDVCLGLYDADSAELGPVDFGRDSPELLQARADTEASYVPSQDAHVAGVKAALKAAVTTAKPKEAIEYAEFTPAMVDVPEGNVPDQPAAPATTAPARTPLDLIKAAIAGAKDAAALKALVPAIRADLTVAEQKAVRPVYDARDAALKGAK